MHHRVLAVTAALAIALAGCGGAPIIEDPRQIVDEGFEALLDLDSFTLDAEVSGTVNMDAGGPSFNLAGTSASAQIDLANRQLAATFNVPAMLGLAGEARIVGGDSYVKTSFTGPNWLRQPADELDAEAQDPQEALEALHEFLNREDVDLRKLEDAECGDDECYHIQIAIPTELLDEAGEDEFGDSASDVLGPALIVDLLFDKQQRYLREASTNVANPEMGDVTLTLRLSAFNEPVSVEAPPADEVEDVDDPGMFLPFP